MDCTGIYTDEVLTGVTISEEKKAEILASDFTGTGKKNDPYQVNSSLGFWYMAEFVNTNGKYIELNCDVIINDENFDEDGNASGGDGIVYQWEGFKYWSTYFEGNGHTAYGYYFNDITVVRNSFFGHNLACNLVKNFNLKNCFVCVGACSSIMAYSAVKIENCHILNGTMHTTNNSAGLTYRCNQIINCSNHANIYGTGGISGFGYNANMANDVMLFDGCVNYGNIISTGAGACGIFCSTSLKTTIRNCKNYGNIIGENCSAGIVSGMFGGSIINCENYGDICIKPNNSYTKDCGGIVDRAYSHQNNIYIIGCKNYGKVYNKARQAASPGTLIGRVDQKEGFTLFVKDCYCYSTENIPIVGITATIYSFEIDGVEAEYNVDGDFSKNIICSNGNEIKTENISIKMKCKNFAGKISKGMKIGKNVLLDVDCTLISSSDNYLCESTDLSVKGVVINIHSPTDSIKQYYGTNFSEFYTSWRTGEIGISAIDRTGVFQNKIDETWLQNNGFIKKS